MAADISVIIATRNRLWSLPRAVESCRSSQLRIEIIVVDDASTDGTSEWLIRQTGLVVVQGFGWGQAWAYNEALSIATGKYIRFLDSDDWLNPNANESQFSVAERGLSDVVVAGLDEYHNDTFDRRIDWIQTDDFIAQQLGETMGSHYSAFLFSRKFIADIPHRTSFPAADFAVRLDRCFILEVALRHPRIAVSPEPTLCHRHHERTRLQFRTGLRSVGTNIQHLYIYRQVLSLLEERQELTSRRKHAAIKILWPLAHWVAHTHPDDAYEIVAWIYRLDPQFSPPEIGLLGFLYRWFGFASAERILRMRRHLLAPVRALM